MAANAYINDAAWPISRAHFERLIGIAGAAAFRIAKRSTSMPKMTRLLLGCLDQIAPRTTMFGGVVKRERLIVMRSAARRSDRLLQMRYAKKPP